MPTLSNANGHEKTHLGLFGVIHLSLGCQPSDLFDGHEKSLLRQVAVIDPNLWCQLSSLAIEHEKSLLRAFLVIDPNLGCLPSSLGNGHEISHLGLQWNLRNKTTIRAMKSVLTFEVVLILRTIIHVYMGLGLNQSGLISPTCISASGLKPL